MNTRVLGCLLGSCVALLATTGCQRKPAPVSYAKDVAPIIEAHCKSCHTPGQPGYVASGPAGSEAVFERWAVSSSAPSTS